jgi:4-diphosphocytidyl-2-C-methyl-D-erythritol kinase
MSPPTSRIRVRAPAKINLCLFVLNRQPDGYHRIFSLMQTVGLYDEIDLRRIASGRRVELSVTGLPIPAGDDNLAVRAARAYLDRYRPGGGVEIRLLKRIPAAAGLGGGSSDAASVLNGLGRLWGLRPPREDLVRLGRSLGSDVPFFLDGPAALVQGTGETVIPVNCREAAWAVLVKPDLSVSTRWAYQKLDEARSRRDVSTLSHHEKFWLTWAGNRNKILADSSAAFQLKELPPYLHNDLETVTGGVHPIIGFIKDRLRLLGAHGALMSGSGPTVFGLFTEPGTAARAARQLRSEDRSLAIWVVRVLRRKPR